MSDTSTYRGVIDLWKTRAAMSRWIIQAIPHSVDPTLEDTTEGQVRGWWSRDSIPEPYFDPIVRAAALCGFPVLTYAHLSGLERGAALRPRDGQPPAPEESRG